MYEIPQTSVGPRSMSELGLLCHRNAACYSLSGSLMEGEERNQRQPFGQTPPGSPFRGHGPSALSKAHPL